MDDLLLYKKLITLPESMKSEVADLIDFLVTKIKKDNSNNNDTHKPKPTFGSGKGTFIMKPDFDDPLEDFKDYTD